MKQKQRERPGAPRAAQRRTLPYAAETNRSGLAGLHGIQADPMSLPVQAVVIQPDTTQRMIGTIQRRSGDRLLQQGRNNVGQTLRQAEVVSKPRESSAPRDAPSIPRHSVPRASSSAPRAHQPSRRQASLSREPQRLTAREAQNQSMSETARQAMREPRDPRRETREREQMSMEERMARINARNDTQRRQIDEHAQRNKPKPPPPDVARAHRALS